MTTAARLDRAESRKMHAMDKLRAWFKQQGYTLGEWVYTIEDIIDVLLDSGFLSPHTIEAKTADIEIEDDE